MPFRGPGSRSSSGPYGLFRERGYRARLLGAAIRHHYHWSQLIGGDVVITMPASWQRRFNASSIEVRPRIDDPVDPAIVDELLTRLPRVPPCVRARCPCCRGFDTYGATARTLRSFIGSYQDLLTRVTDALIPDPDVRG